MSGFFFGGGFSVLFMLMFVLVFGMIIFAVVRSAGEWHKNNQSPRLTVDATVVAKRSHISRHHHANSHHTSNTTSYYVTFQVESGDRMELHVGGYEYGLLVEGDVGKLTFQGTRYLGFERI